MDWQGSYLIAQFCSGKLLPNMVSRLIVKVRVSNFFSITWSNNISLDISNITIGVLVKFHSFWRLSSKFVLLLSELVDDSGLNIDLKETLDQMLVIYHLCESIR